MPVTLSNCPLSLTGRIYQDLTMLRSTTAAIAVAMALLSCYVAAFADAPALPAASTSATPSAVSSPSASTVSKASPAPTPAPQGQAQNKNFDLFDPDTWPVIPVPEVATDPNTGTFVGVLLVFLQTDANRDIKDIIAPDINWNTTLGPGGNFRYLAYPSADNQWFAVGGAAERKYAHFEGDWANGITRKSPWSYEAHFLFEDDPTERFFGLGDSSHFEKQTNYLTERVFLDVILLRNLTEHFSIGLNIEPQWLRIKRGAFNFPFIGTLFPNLKGIDGGTTVRNRVLATYDTRDSVSIPRHGVQATVFAGVTDRAFLSSASFAEFGGDVRHYLPIGERFTLASHVFARYVPGGSETPFWMMSWLGGDGPGEGNLLSLPLNRQVTWRGYGAGRYEDNNVFAANVELRTRVWSADIFQTHGVLELAPFVDAGQVFHNADDSPVGHLHPATGVGFRGIAEPFVVGYVDVGYGGNGVSFFSGINYPF